eukprot:TRINITY_DN19740_c0_g1_i1.p1 TRINITY_DN19740_c0_g1~~TRINITY_DN19740_c0_g1_i1.p1  ORF type:complete len:510 (-),score=107.93 TRINITY_DN19740_c0_g1_i1:92-1621(-)
MKLKKKFQDSVIGWLEKKYPGVRDIVDLLDNVRERVDTQYIKGLTELEDLTEHDKEEMKDILKESGITIENHNEEETQLYPKLPSEDNPDKPNTIDDKTTTADQKNVEIFKPDDGKWRPVVLTLGLVYKLQKITDDYWYDVDSVFMQNKENITLLVELLAKYWWYSMDVATSIKGDDEELYENLAKGLKIPQDDILYAFVKDADKAIVAEHCPDIALVVHHANKEVVLTVCGTKMFPAPSVADIMMDLYCESIPFHKGRAHKGMAVACDNILAKVMDTMVERLAELPDYKLVIIGYSLGAGVAQLITLKLTDGEEKAKMPSNEVLCITFGAPPVYISDEPGYINPSIISVYNHSDGLSSLSLHTVTKLFLQIRAINRLGISRKRTFKLLRTKLGESVEQDGFKTGVRRFVSSSAEKDKEWADITTAVQAVTETGFSQLCHTAGVTYLLKRSDIGHVVRMLEGGKAVHLSQELRLRGGMFNDHMPWGYGGLFKECGGNTTGLTLDMLKYL